MGISLKMSRLFCLFLLSSFYAVLHSNFATGLLTVGVPQQYLVSFSLPGSILYYSHFTKRLYKQVSVNTTSNRNKNTFKTTSIQKV